MRGRLDLGEAERISNVRVGMHRKRTWIWTALLLALVMLASLPALPAGREVVKARVSSGGINFAAQMPNNGLIVTVGGAGGLVSFQKSYKGRQSASLSFADLLGKNMNRLPDGVYQWEATVIPSRSS